MLKDTHELFEKHKVIYFADGGTLLWAVRHKGIVSNDDDDDIGIAIEDYDKFLSLTYEFKKLGYNIDADSYNGNNWIQIRYTIYKEDDGGPLIDVFPCKN